MAADRSPDVQANASRQALIVLGMHRSGTSAVSGVLATLGAQAPKTLLPNARDNPRGFWESAEVVRFHEQLLRTSGSRWSDWDLFNPDWLESGRADEFLGLVPALIEQEFGDARLLLLKDPRMCRFIPFWLKALERMNVAPKIVIPLRHPAEVAESLAARNKLGRSRALLLWLRHMLDAEAGTRGVQRVFVRYTDFLANWRAPAKRIGIELGIKWPRWSSSVELEIDRFLSSELRHQVVSGLEVSSSAGLQDWVRRTYGAFERLADGSNINVAGVLDAVKNDFDRQSQTFAAVVYEHGVLASEDVQRKEKQRSNFERRVTALEEQVEQKSKSETELEIQIASLNKKNSEHLGELAKRDRQIESLADESQRLRKENSRVQTELVQRQQDLLRAANDVEHVRTKQSVMEQRLALRTNELARITRMLMQRDGELEDLGKEKSRLAAKLRKFDERVAAHGAEIDKHRREASALAARQNNEIATLRDELKRIRGSITWRMGAPVRSLMRGVRRLLLRTSPSDADLLRQSSWFDAGWYVARYPDVANDGADPVIHYLNFGAGEGRDPGPRFNTKRYLEQNPDVALSGTNALLHYLKHGEQEGRKPC